MYAKGLTLSNFVSRGVGFISELGCVLLLFNHKAHKVWHKGHKGLISILNSRDSLAFFEML
jgi:hypothetical protein